MEIILASSSPRRRAFLERMGIDFRVVHSEFDESSIKPEDYNGLEPYVEALAKGKAEYINRDGDLVIAADTIVVLDGEILGKPSGPGEAREMLGKLSGKTHQVYTGICVYSPKGIDTDHDVTRVGFKILDPARVEEYIATGGPLDKAGAYGIQEPIVAEHFIGGIDGSYNNVVGLPTKKLIPILERHGVSVS